MRVSLESTTRIVEVRMPDGAVVTARMWEGTTERGVRCFALITRIAPGIQDPPPAVCEEFQRDLQECRAPSLDLDRAIPHRLIL